MKLHDFVFEIFKEHSKNDSLKTRLKEASPFRRSSSRLKTIDLTSAKSGDLDILFRKEVIQPQVPLRLPCYDFTPVTDCSLEPCPPCGLARALLEKPTPMV
jgi:hypothetical protein